MSEPTPDWHRVSIRHDGVEIIGLTVTGERPENREQIKELIRELLRIMEAPGVKDEEL